MKSSQAGTANCLKFGKNWVIKNPQKCFIDFKKIFLLAIFCLANYCERFAFQVLQASVAHKAHATRTGWKNKRINLDVSELSPKASTLLTY